MNQTSLQTRPTARKETLYMEWYRAQGDLAHGFNSYTLREQGVHEFAWAIPTRKVLQTLRSFDPLFEVGAGTGYWAYELKNIGADIIATDVDPDKKTGYNMKKDNWIEVIQMEGLDAVAKFSQTRTLFMCWPSYRDKWSGETLQKYTAAVSRGKYFIYVGESWGGCTGDEVFHEVLNEHWNENHVIEIPQWYGIHDHMFIYTKK